MIDLQRLAGEIDAEVDARVREGRCGCGCGGVLPVVYQGRGRDRHRVPFECGRKRFVLESHRQRQYRRKLRRLAEAQGVTAPLSLRMVNAATTTQDRHGDAQSTRRKRQSKPRTGLSVYFPSVEDALRAQQALAAIRHPHPTIFAGARQAIDRALGRHARKAAS